MTHSFAFFPCLWVTCVLSLCGGISVFRGFEACSPPLPTPQRHSPLPPQQHRAFCWRNVGSSRWGGGSPCHQRGAAVAQDRGLSWHQASSPRVALNLHINLHKTLIGDKCTCFFIYGALQVYTEISFEQKKKKKIKLPASALCRIKANGAWAPLHRRFAIDPMPLWDGVSGPWIHYQPWAPSWVCLHQCLCDEAEREKLGCFRAASQLTLLLVFLSVCSRRCCCVLWSWSYTL